MVGMSQELRPQYIRNLREQYIVIEEAARVLRDIMEVLPDCRVVARLYLPDRDVDDPAIEDLRRAARSVLKVCC
jgi:hypothetical protein